MASPLTASIQLVSYRCNPIAELRGSGQAGNVFEFL